MCKRRIEGDFDYTNKESNGKSSEEDGIKLPNCDRKGSEEEQIKLPKCGRKGDVKNLNEETKESISEEEDIGIRKCRRKFGLIKSIRKRRDQHPHQNNNNILLKEQRQKRRIV